MKKIIIFLLLVFSFYGCIRTVDEVDYFENNEYIGFEDADTNLSRQDCIDSGFLVLDGIKIQENYDKVQKFIDNTEAGNPDRLRIARFHDSKGPAYSDLIFDEGRYYFYYMDEEDYLANAYSYLLVLEGEWGLPIQKYKMLVLSDDKTLTFDELNKAMVSSSLEYINSIGRHRIVLYTY